jgi:hypothetical protein
MPDGEENVMKTILIRSLVVVISSAVLATMAYSQSMSGMGGCCGGSTPATTAQLTCGTGTHMVNNQCVLNQ